MRHKADSEEELPYVHLGYLPFEAFESERGGIVTYGEEENWKEIGYVTEKPNDKGEILFTAFDENNKIVVPETANQQEVDRYFQRIGNQLRAQEREREVTLKSIRRNKSKNHERGIEP